MSESRPQRRITDRGFHHLARIPTLREVDLRESRVTEVGIDDLLARPRIRALGLHYTPVSGAEAIRRIEAAHPGLDVSGSW
jgi:hypothetical protein